MAARRRKARKKTTRKAPARRRKATRRTTRRRAATRSVGGASLNSMLRAHKEEITLIMLFLAVLFVFGYFV